MQHPFELSIEDLQSIDLNLADSNSDRIVGGSGESSIPFGAPVQPRYIVDPKHPNRLILDVADWEEQLKKPRYPLPTYNPHQPFM